MINAEELGRDLNILSMRMTGLLLEHPEWRNTYLSELKNELGDLTYNFACFLDDHV